jgi:hypothetical protein
MAKFKIKEKITQEIRNHKGLYQVESGGILGLTYFRLDCPFCDKTHRESLTQLIAFGIDCSCGAKLNKKQGFKKI